MICNTSDEAEDNQCKIVQCQANDDVQCMAATQRQSNTSFRTETNTMQANTQVAHTRVQIMQYNGTAVSMLGGFV